MVTDTPPAEKAEEEAQVQAPPATQADPSVKGETVSIPKAEYDDLQARLRNAANYTRRKVEEETGKLRKDLESQLKGIQSTGDPNVDAARERVAADRAALEEQRKAFQAEKVQSLAETLAIRYGIDAGDLATEDTELGVRAKAAELALAKQKAENATATGIDRGRGGGSALTDDEKIRLHGLGQYNDNADIRQILARKAKGG